MIVGDSELRTSGGSGALYLSSSGEDKMNMKQIALVGVIVAGLSVAYGSEEDIRAKVASRLQEIETQFKRNLERKAQLLESIQKAQEEVRQIDLRNLRLDGAAAALQELRVTLEDGATTATALLKKSSFIGPDGQPLVSSPLPVEELNKLAREGKLQEPAGE